MSHIKDKFDGPKEVNYIKDDEESNKIDLEYALDNISLDKAHGIDEIKGNVIDVIRKTTT